MTLLEYFANSNSQESFILKSPLASKICGHMYLQKDMSYAMLMIEADIFSAEEIKKYSKSLPKIEAYPILVTPELLQEAKVELAETEQEIRDKRQKMCVLHKDKMNQLADAMEKESGQYYEVDNQLKKQLQRIDEIDTQLELYKKSLTNEEREGDIQ